MKPLALLQDLAAESDATDGLEALVDDAPAGDGLAPVAGLVVAWCRRTDHPTLAGRVLVTWDDPRGASRERWLPTLHGLAVRPGDRLLVQRPANWSEAVVTGVLDGLRARGESPAPIAGLTLLPDESLRVCAADGAPLVEIRPSDEGPVVRLCRRDVDIEVDGGLRLRAESIALCATRGEVTIDATDDVVVRGETIHLN